MPDTWSGSRVRRARAIVEQWLPADCARCGEPVLPSQRWVVGHRLARWDRPDLIDEPSNWQPEHRGCSDRTGQREVIAKAKAEALAEAGVSSDGNPATQPPPLLAYTHKGKADPLEVREALTWPALVASAPDWAKGFLDVPDNASPPLASTPWHPRSTGSYGPAAVEWIEANLPDVQTLRWWQRLAFLRQLEHDADGALVWRVIVESGPRRIGKSVRLRGLALWRLDQGPALFPEPQLVVHTGKDREIVKEIHRKAWPWAMTRPGWDVRRGAGQEEVSAANGVHRWFVRSTDSVYGYDCTTAAVDEAWAVDPATFDEGLEPSTMERISAQSLLTSTAHRRATSLMRGRISNALADEDGETLLLLWGARPQDDPADPQVWRAASPHWSADRAQMIATKYAKALAGEADPTADDPDPLAGFEAQYLNKWRLRQPKAQRGEGVVTEDGWSALVADPLWDKPDASAIEGWPGEGISLALAWRVDGRAVLSVTDHPDLTAAAATLAESGFKGTAIVGASLLDDPALKKTRKRKATARTGAAVADLARLLAEDALRHDGGDHLTGQVLGVRTLPGADGPRMASTGRADAIKAAAWAVEQCRKAGSGSVKIILPTNV